MSSQNRRGELGTGFTPTSSEIGMAFQPNPTASCTLARSTTVARIRRRADQKNQLLMNMPDMETVLCVFTGMPIGEEGKFAFIRCRKGSAADTRLVMCLASCDVDDSRYEVLPVEDDGLPIFRKAIANMVNASNPVNRSLYYEDSAPAERVPDPDRSSSRRAPRRLSSSLQFAPS